MGSVPLCLFKGWPAHSLANSNTAPYDPTGILLFVDVEKNEVQQSICISLTGVDRFGQRFSETCWSPDDSKVTSTALGKLADLHSDQSTDLLRESALEEKVGVSGIKFDRSSALLGFNRCGDQFPIEHVFQANVIDSETGSVIFQKKSRHFVDFCHSGTKQCVLLMHNRKIGGELQANLEVWDLSGPQDRLQQFQSVSGMSHPCLALGNASDPGLLFGGMYESCFLSFYDVSTESEVWRSEYQTAQWVSSPDQCSVAVVPGVASYGPPRDTVLKCILIQKW